MSARIHQLGWTPLRSTRAVTTCVRRSRSRTAAGSSGPKSVVSRSQTSRSRAAREGSSRSQQRDTKSRPGWGPSPPGQERQQQGMISMGQSPWELASPEKDVMGGSLPPSALDVKPWGQSVRPASAPALVGRCCRTGLRLVGYGDNVLDLHRMQGVGQGHVRDDGKPEVLHAGVDRDQDLGNG